MKFFNLINSEMKKLVYKYILPLLIFTVSVSDIYSQKIEFSLNNKKIEADALNKIIIYENDICKVIIHDTAKQYYRLEKTDEAELKKPVNFGAYGTGLSPKYAIFTLTGLKPGKIYSFNIKKIIPRKDYDAEVKTSGTLSNTVEYDSIQSALSKNTTDSIFKRETSYKLKSADTNTIFDFYVEVHEITHIEAGIGPVFSNLEFNNYILTSIPGDSTGSMTIKNIGTKNQIDFVLGAIIRPWGYDQRGNFGDWHNAFLYFGLGLNSNKKFYENLYVGAGFGFRAFSIVGGIHISPVEMLLDGYTENGKYKSNEIDKIDNIKTTSTKINIFGGLLIDLSIFDNVFSKIF